MCAALLMIALFCAEIKSISVKSVEAKQPTCGFPGTPAYGYVKPDRAAYSEGEVVSYSCRVGYILLGSPISRCTDDGSWSEDVPICDDSMTTLGVAFSTPTVPGHSAELAIDRDKETCAYLKPKKPRWWRIDLGEEHKVLSVAVTMISPDKYVKFTVFVIKTQGTSASYKRCASFSGKFGTETVVLSCSEGKGIEGQKVHIEDHHQTEGFFEICEVEVQVEKDTGYDCGRPSRSLYSITFEPKNDMVEYGCIRGYEIKGSDYRHCLSTGQWSGEPPICEPIICDELEELENGHIRITHDSDGPPLEGAVVIYKCNEGYKLEGPFTRNCLKDGSWSGKDPQCKVIRCPVPDGKDQGGVYRLVNKTNSMGSMAMLRCKGGKREGDNPYIVCTEDGDWTEPEAHCILPARAAYERRDEPRIMNQGVIIFGMVVAAIMIVVVLVAMYLYGQKRNSNKPELPSRLLEPPVPPPRPPPRAKGGAFRNAFMGLINRDGSGSPEDPKWKTQSLPTNHTNAVEETTGKYSPKRALSYGQTLDGMNTTEPSVIEVEVLAHDDSGKKRRFPPVPEQNEDASLENVILDVEDPGSNKDSTPKQTRSAASDYASVDYEKKRQSRLLKEQDSVDSSSTGAASPLPQDEPDKKESRSPTPPKHISHSEEDDDDEKEEDDEEEDEEEGEEEESETSSVQAREEVEKARKVREVEERKAEEERKAKEEEERKAREEEERKAKEEEEKKKAEAPAQRRRRIRDEPPPAVEERPVLRRFRQR
ncbi:sushi, von Willebrand factor type A, EGF and pentraxin domain-containing protein 1 [Trichonephila clavata]|uniref:Sushi, von Willebrand factor type A, EGF and pentraxin domain-containing protein 1 n=1 Tax=Trichonephila clavata TaxID=2740835 RepID=A0A8X6G356_TRICU|nr:sushi, von Willebrand factor type A, EGF and pentraxin domain-containing protein 1 [Trichonephila clavata]